MRAEPEYEVAGALTLEAYPEVMVVIRCAACGREGRYRRDKLVERFGPTAVLPEVLNALTVDCRRGGFGSDPQCRRAVFIDPATDAPWRR